MLPLIGKNSHPRIKEISHHFNKLHKTKQKYKESIILISGNIFISESGLDFLKKIDSM